MKILPDPIRTTIIGGAIFLVPLVIVVAIAGKAIQLMMVIAEPIDDLIPIENVAGIAFVNILAIVAVLVLCYLAGLSAQSGYGKKLRDSIHTVLLNVIPGYAFVKGLTDNMDSNTEAAKEFIPVIVKFDDNAQIGFEVERSPDNYVVVYLPGAPNPWSGTVAYFKEEQIQKLDMTVRQAIQNIQQLGRGSAAYSQRIKNT